MTLGNLKTLIRAFQPTAHTSKLDDTILELLINQGVIDVAAYTKCLKGNKKIDVAENVFEYALSEKVTDYLYPDKPGLFWYDGTDWQDLYTFTLKRLDNEHPLWRDLDAADPLRYSIDGDILTVSPTPDTALSEGFWLYYVKKPVAMTADDQYPFSGTTTEYPHLSIFDMAIVYYVLWKLSPAFNTKEESYIYNQKRYDAEREEKRKLFNRRPDIVSNARMEIEG